MLDITQLYFQGEQNVVVAEWLRRWTRNPLGFPRVGSNPTDYEELFSLFLTLTSKYWEKIF